MKKILFIFVALALCANAFAKPAWHGIYKHTLPDGTVVTLQKHGDEFFHWTTDASGQVVELDSNGWLRTVSTESFTLKRNSARIKRAARNQVYRSGEHIAVGQKRFLVILVEFSDVTFSTANPRQDFDKMLNQQGFSDRGATGSARDYYYDNSHGYFEPVFDVFGPVQLENEMAHYGGNDSGGNDLEAESAVMEGCKALDDEIDFSKYDLDGDGKVDLVFMFYAGYGEADSDVTDSIWPHRWYLSYAGKSVTLDGKKIDSYACSNELIGFGEMKGQIDGIGAVCHEFGHAMGLPDFYDTDYTGNGYAGGTYDYSLMCGGTYNNESRTPPRLGIEERMLIGWIDESAVTEIAEKGNYTLEDLDSNTAFKTATDENGEYFLYECRAKTGWDAYIPEEGLIIYHVDKSTRSVSLDYGDGDVYNVPAIYLWDYWENYNGLNMNGSHPCCYIVPAGDQSSLNYYGSKFAFPGAAYETSFAPRSWNGVDSSVTLKNISYSGGVVTFFADAPSAELDYSVIANPGNGVYSAGDSFDLSLVEGEKRRVASVQWYFDDEPVSGDSVVLRAGAHTVEAVITLYSGATDTLTLDITVN
ncbi:MAG: M6 family metalloprotease domain-containing protein [Bacteroidales bacterium]|nr:M6 family metalloprotease domain-containing protein [Bacteroidales bacterium]